MVGFRKFSLYGTKTWHLQHSTENMLLTDIKFMTIYNKLCTLQTLLFYYKLEQTQLTTKKCTNKCLKLTSSNSRKNSSKWQPEWQIWRPFSLSNSISENSLLLGLKKWSNFLANIRWLASSNFFNASVGFWKKCLFTHYYKH